MGICGVLGIVFLYQIIWRYTMKKKTIKSIGKIPMSPLITFKGNVGEFKKLTVDVRDIASLALHNQPNQIGNFNIIMKGGRQSFRILRRRPDGDYIESPEQQDCIDEALQLYDLVLSTWEYFAKQGVTNLIN